MSQLSSLDLNFYVILPEFVLVIFAMLIMVADMFTGDRRPATSPRHALDRPDLA